MGSGRTASTVTSQDNGLVHHSGSRTVIVFLLLAQYARKETVIGYLTPTAGTVKIFAPQQGTIDAIYVEQGQRIEEAQPLMSITTSQIAANGQDVNATLLNTLTVHKILLAWQSRQTSSERRPSGNV